MPEANTQSTTIVLNKTSHLDTSHHTARNYLNQTKNRVFMAFKSEAFNTTFNQRLYTRSEIVNDSFGNEKEDGTSHN